MTDILNPTEVKTDLVTSMEAYATFEGSGPEAWEGIKERIAELLATIAEYRHALGHVIDCTNNAACANCHAVALAAVQTKPNFEWLKEGFIEEFDSFDVNLIDDKDEEEEDD